MLIKYQTYVKFLTRRGAYIEENSERYYLLAVFGVKNRMFIIVNLFLIYREKVCCSVYWEEVKCWKNFYIYRELFFYLIRRGNKSLYIEKVLCITVYFFRIFGLLEEEIKVYI